MNVQNHMYTPILDLRDKRPIYKYLFDLHTVYLFSFNDCEACGQLVLKWHSIYKVHLLKQIVILITWKGTLIVCAIEDKKW